MTQSHEANKGDPRQRDVTRSLFCLCVSMFLFVASKMFIFIVVMSAGGCGPDEAALHRVLLYSYIALQFILPTIGIYYGLRSMRHGIKIDSIMLVSMTIVLIVVALLLFSRWLSPFPI